MDSGNVLRGQADLFALLEDALRGSPADQTELLVLNDLTDVTRYANSEIHQNVEQADTRVSVRVAVGKSAARVFTHSLDRDEIRATIERATSLARLGTPNPRFVSLPSPDMGGSPPEKSPQSFFESTAGQTPESRAGAVGRVIEAAGEEGFQAYGTYLSSASELAIVSSTGIHSYTRYTTAYMKALVEGPDGTGFGDALDRDANRIDAARIAALAVAKCRANRDQREIEPGDYEALFDPNAVADMLRFPTGWGMGARSVLDGQSFLAGKLGEQVVAPHISIWDDPTDPRCLPIAIDYEGLPTQGVDIISGGIAMGPVYDTQTAYEAGTRSTGNAAQPFGDFPAGPQANHIVMQPGTSTGEEMLSHIARGVWVTRFHYTHCPDPKRVIATGTTRDGTFLIEGGQVVAALKNLRLEMSVLDLLSSLEEAGEGKLCQDWWSQNGMSDLHFFVPAMRFGRCTFTGVTTF